MVAPVVWGRGRPGDSGSRPQPLLLFSHVGGICSIAQATLGVAKGTFWM